MRIEEQVRSDRTAVETCTLEQMAYDVAALCDLLGIDAAVILGHSFGGFVALHVALRRPDLVRGLILCDTAPTLAPLPADDRHAGRRAGCCLDPPPTTACVGPFIPTAIRVIPNSASQQIPASANLGPGV